MKTIFIDLTASRPSYNNQEGWIYDYDSSDDNKEIRYIFNLDELIKSIIVAEVYDDQTI